MKFLYNPEVGRIALKETDYCYVLAQAWEAAVGDSICLERIFVKGGGEEIRLAWWKNGNQAARPADIEVAAWGPLFATAVKNRVFSDSEKFGMVKALLA